MKSDFQFKLLQSLSNKNSEKGFTLIELLVVIIIIGILSAIALPSFLNQANRARESEAKQYVGSLNRAQQAYVLAKPNFVTDTADIAKLELGIPTQTTFYNYEIVGTTNLVTNQAITIDDTKAATTTAKVKAVVGGVAVTTIATGEATSVAVLCIGTKAGVAGGPNGADQFTAITGDAATDCADPGAYETL